MPRGIGASIGVKETAGWTMSAIAWPLGLPPAASASACSISGVCRCVPPTW